MKLVNFKTGESKDLSEWEAHKLVQETPKDELLPTREYELIRTKEFVLYVLNKKTRTKYSIKIRRCLALLAKEHNCLMKYYEKDMVAYTEDAEYFYVFVDRVRNNDEIKYHEEKFKNKYIYKIKNKKVICLQKSDLCPYIELDFDTIRDYYKGFTFPAFFRDYAKMRHFRIMDMKMRFFFVERRLTDTSKHSMDEKFRHTVLKCKSPSKLYFSICRMLDSKLEAKGLGFPLKNMMYFCLDVDGSCDKEHLIDERGICIKCLENAKEKVEKVEKRLKEHGKIEIVKILFSGTKGFHLHLSLDGKREVYEKDFLDAINFINQNEELVDPFVFERNGEEQYDNHRIMRIPDGIEGSTACKVSEEITRLPVDDRIIYPK